VKENVKENIDKKTKQKIIALISALIPEAKIYLFGSRATGKHTQWSDIDIAIDVGKKLDRALVGEVINVVAGTDIVYKVEIVDVHSVSEDMRKSILEERVIWKN